jgi:tetratricopeptide (TPR) repeat protein
MLMQDRSVRVLGLVLALSYASFIVWLYFRQPQTIAEVTGGLSASVGAYRIDQQAFDDGVTAFRREQFEAARAAFERADPAQQDARTQFYIAYSYYRSGWGRLYNDDVHFKQGLERVDKAIGLAPNGRLLVEDPENFMHNADELRAELAAGLRTEASDLNPLRVFRKRK